MTAEWRDFVFGEIALREGRTADAIGLLQTGLPGLRVFQSPLYFLGAEALAEAQLKRQQPEQAIAVLEAVIPQKIAAAFTGSDAFWLHAAWELAKLYRSASRPYDAARVEADLRGFLRHADADHPIVVGLQRHATSPTQ